MSTKKTLPMTDALNFAAIAHPGERYEALIRHATAATPINSYAPIRQNLVDLLRVTPPMFAANFPDDPRIFRRVSARCKTEVEESMNLGAARALVRFRDQKNIIGRDAEFSTRVRILAGYDIDVCSKFVLVWDAETYIVAFDFRNRHGYTADGRAFLYALINERVRLSAEDYIPCNVALLSVKAEKDARETSYTAGNDNKTATKSKVVSVATAMLGDLPDLDFVEHELRHTYRTWERIISDAKATNRGTGTEGNA